MSLEVNRPLRAIALKVLYAFLSTILLSIIKSIKDMPVTELVFFRSFFAVVPFAAYLFLRRRLASSLRTGRPFGHLGRAVLSLITMCLMFLAVRSLPLPEAVTLQYSQPLFVVALSALFLGESVRLFRWAAVLIGFFGTLVITWPKLTLLGGDAAPGSQAEIIGAVAALSAAMSLAVTMIFLRLLVRTESSTTITLWLGIYTSGLLVLTMPFGWIIPNLTQLALLAGTGLLGIAVQLAQNEALRAAPASTTAPFEYSSLLFAIGLGFFLFGELPDLYTIIGSAFLVGSGLMILWREHQLNGRATPPISGGLPPSR